MEISSLNSNKGYGLEPYILGTKTMPGQHITTTEGVLLRNREYTIYQRI